jgi:hypothetical protein
MFSEIQGGNYGNNGQIVQNQTNTVNPNTNNTEDFLDGKSQ